MIRLINAVIIICACTLAACSSNPKQPPSWVTSPPQDTEQSIFGIGSGLSLEIAKRNAKNDIAEKVQTSISANLSSSQTLSMGQSSRSFQETIKTESANLNLRGISFIESSQIDHQFYVQVKIPRSQIINDIQQRRQANETAIINALNKQDTRSTLENYIALNKLKYEAKKLSTLAFIQKGLDPSFNPKQSITVSQAHTSATAAHQQKLRVYLDKSARAQNTRVALANQLSQNGLKLTNSPSKADLKISLKSSITDQSVFQTKTSLLTTDISLQNKQAQTIFSEQLQGTGSSMSDFRKARVLADKDLSLKVDQSQIFIFLGLNKQE